MKLFSSLYFGLVAVLTMLRAETMSAGDAATNSPAASAPVLKSGPPAPTYFRDVLPIVMGRCVRCHGEPERQLPDFMDYDTAYKNRVELRRRVWQSWEGSYHKQPMPPGNNFEARTMTEEERAVIKRWVESGAPRGVAVTNDVTLSKPERIEAGKKLFGTVCAACHQPAGQGIPGRFPPLAASDYLNADKDRAINALLNGLQGEVVVNGQKFSNSMPRFPLGDEDIANVLTYVYGSMGNSGKEVTAAEVHAARNGMAAHTAKQSATAEVRSAFE